MGVKGGRWLTFVCSVIRNACSAKSARCFSAANARSLLIRSASAYARRCTSEEKWI